MNIRTETCACTNCIYMGPLPANVATCSCAWVNFPAYTSLSSCRRNSNNGCRRKSLAKLLCVKNQKQTVSQIVCVLSFPHMTKDDDILIYTYIHTHIHTNIFPQMTKDDDIVIHTYIHTYIHTCLFPQMTKDDDGEELPDETLRAEAAALG